MDLFLLSLAFTAGLFTFLSPCTIAFFPIYMAYFLRLKGNNTFTLGVLAGLLAGIGASLVFLALGFASSIIVMMLLSNYLFIKIVLGLILIILGLITISPGGIVFNVPVPSLEFVGGFYLSSLLYGVVYAFASLSCSLPVFLMVIFTSASSGGFLGLLTSFIAYALGLITPMMTLSVAIIYFKGVIERPYSSLASNFKRISGILLIVGGLYLLFFG